MKGAPVEERLSRDYFGDAAASASIDAPRGARSILWLTVLLFGSALAWASWAELDEVTSGTGSVIPSSQIQQIQNLEGGILSALLVAEGDRVAAGEPLLRIDDTGFSASLRETEQQIRALQAQAIRLLAEAEGGEFNAPPELREQAPQLIEQERVLLRSRLETHASEREIQRQRRYQIDQELQELQSRRKRTARGLALARKELRMTRPLVASGAISEVEVLRLERQVNDLAGELEQIEISIPRMSSRQREAEQRLEEIRLKFRSAARTELAQVNTQLSRLQESRVAVEDRVERTLVRSPVSGTVKRILVNTVGGVIQPGMNLMEIVPLEDHLLVEARVAPRDIAFLRLDLPAKVRISAYDFSIYGALEGRVEHISADSIRDEDRGGSYFLVRVKTEKSHLGSKQGKLPILSGMQAEVDILTGRKSVMDYLLKPVFRAKEKALRER